MSGVPPAATIFALATPAGRGAVAVVRLSGPRSAEVVTALCSRRLPPPRRAVLRKLRTSDGELVDEGLVLWMPGPASFTGEDCAEFHLHGGPAIVETVFQMLVAAGLRLAEPGEFTRRAFENGRLDLTQAEAIGDLIDAESSGQRRQALAQLGGVLSQQYEVWRDALLDALALIEAEIDFSEEDVPDAISTLASPRLSRVASEMQSAAGNLHGERVREGFRFAIIGAPNVGKSCLLNALVKRDAAIVTAIAGTTRDIIEATISLGGQSVVLADTAGLRQANEPIEAEGIRRGETWSHSADLRIGVVDATRLETLQDVIEVVRPGDIIVLNKTDLGGSGVLQPIAPDIEVVTAAAGKADVARLQEALVQWLQSRSGEREFPAITRGRHRALLLEAIEHLIRGINDLSRGAELAAESVRLAVRALERITGRSDPEAVLDRVFTSFCIGK